MNPLPIFEDVTVYDELEPCPYLEKETARLPLQIPSQRVTPEQIDARLASGQRRTGEFVYSTSCPNCTACQPIRLPVQDFRMGATYRKTLRRNDDSLRAYIGNVVVDEERVTLFNKHRKLRQLGRSSSAIEAEEYAWAFQRSCFETFEISYSLNGKLICVAICDQGKESLSAVYTFFEPELAKMSLGTYSILKQIEYCQQTNREFLYLGFYIEQCRNMSYKSAFVPNERMLDGKWQLFG